MDRGVDVGRGVGVGLGVAVGRGVGVGRGVTVGSGVGVGVGVAVGIDVGVAVGSGVGVGVGSGVGVGVGATVGVAVPSLTVQLPPGFSRTVISLSKASSLSNPLVHRRRLSTVSPNCLAGPPSRQIVPSCCADRMTSALEIPPPV